MASISRESNGRKTIQFVSPDGRRRSIRLGKMSQRTAESLKMRVEHLLSAKITGYALDDETSRWLAGLDDVMRAKLSKVGLIPEQETTLLGPFIRSYINSRCDVKPATATVYSHTQRNLFDLFGQDRRLRDITPGEAEAWRLDLIKQGLADNTVRRRCGIARQFFRAALRRGLISSNPFDELAVTVRPNTKRMYFVSREEAEEVLLACLDAEWRLVFALSRFGGLRCPSETLALRWEDVDWEKGRMLVHSPKTEHHVGGESRWVPIFLELLPYLRDVFEQAEPGVEYVITRYRDATVNLRTRMLKTVKRAGLKPWPKLFQNLRSTRQTELEEVFPSHVVCAWMGNSRPVAMKHYLQVTDEHFQRAISECSALQNPVQQAHAKAGKRVQAAQSHSQEPPSCGSEQLLASSFSKRGNPPLGPAGLEPATQRL